MDAVRQRSASPPWKRPQQPLPSPNHLHQPNRYVDGLPSISYLDIAKIQEATSDYSHANLSSATINMPATLQTSPSNMWSGPPPPYSYPPSSASSVVGLAGYISPPESRRTSDDDKEPSSQTQSLPSIHEALGKDQQILYRPKPPPIVPPATSLPPSLRTPTTPIPHSHPEAILSGPPNPYASSQAPGYSHDLIDRRLQSTARKGSQGDESNSRSARPSLHDTTIHSHPTNPISISSPNPSVRPSPRIHRHPASSPMYHSAIPPPSSLPPQPVHFNQPAHSYPLQPPSVLAPQYQYIQQPSWQADGPDVDRAEATRKAGLKRSPRSTHHYGESVKRHLDIFDFETSLNEVSDANALLDLLADPSVRLRKEAVVLWSFLASLATVHTRVKDQVLYQALCQHCMNARK